MLWWKYILKLIIGVNVSGYRVTAWSNFVMLNCRPGTVGVFVFVLFLCVSKQISSWEITKRVILDIFEYWKHHKHLRLFESLHKLVLLTLCCRPWTMEAYIYDICPYPLTVLSAPSAVRHLNTYLRSAMTADTLSGRAPTGTDAEAVVLEYNNKAMENKLPIWELRVNTHSSGVYPV